MRALTELKKECFNRIGSSSCFCCPEYKLKRLLAHHLSYTSKSVTYNKWGNSDDERLKYYSNLLDEIKEDKDNFLVMCFNCHKELERLLKLTFEEVKQSIQTIINENIIFAYNITRKKRGLLTLENPHDDIKPPKFLSDFNIFYYLQGDDDFISKEVLRISNKIQGKEFSLNDFASSVTLSQNISDYIKPYPFYIYAAKLLESVRDVKKGDNISYIRIINNPFVKPIELVRKAEIDSKYYLDWFKTIFLRLYRDKFTEYDFDKFAHISGLDEFFWS